MNVLECRVCSRCLPAKRAAGLHLLDGVLEHGRIASGGA